MKDKKQHSDDCGCEHHEHSDSPAHHIDGKCPTDLLFDNIIENLKKEFEQESDDK
ncbi:MAG: hypothetical protein BAJALOKI1v1_70027 [Promethearchaeota archaeon]|nr:MAG: hypothetical protein BAJALOKI1v1_70027 [Candidatus Lokiarchaeota archaeon]